MQDRVVVHTIGEQSNQKGLVQRLFQRFLAGLIGGNYFELNPDGIGLREYPREGRVQQAPDIEHAFVQRHVRILFPELVVHHLVGDRANLFILQVIAQDVLEDKRRSIHRIQILQRHDAHLAQLALIHPGRVAVFHRVEHRSKVVGSPDSFYFL